MFRKSLTVIEGVTPQEFDTMANANTVTKVDGEETNPVYTLVITAEGIGERTKEVKCNPSDELFIIAHSLHDQIVDLTYEFVKDFEDNMVNPALGPVRGVASLRDHKGRDLGAEHRCGVALRVSVEVG